MSDNNACPPMRAILAWDYEKQPIFLVCLLSKGLKLWSGVTVLAEDISQRVEFVATHEMRLRKSQTLPSGCECGHPKIPSQFAGNYYAYSVMIPLYSLDTLKSKNTFKFFPIPRPWASQCSTTLYSWALN